MKIITKKTEEVLIGDYIFANNSFKKVVYYSKIVVEEKFKAPNYSLFDTADGKLLKFYEGEILLVLEDGNE